MPARKRTSAGTSVAANSSGGDEDSNKDSVAYKNKRKRNNDAVKKTREKSKKTADARKEHVEHLKKENVQLEARIEEVKKHVETLKGILLHTADPEDHDMLIKKILEEKSEDEDESSTT